MNTTIIPEIQPCTASACTVEGGSLMQRGTATLRMFTLFPNFTEKYEEEAFEWVLKTSEPMPYAVMEPLYDESQLELSQAFDIPESFPALPRLEDLDLD